MSFEFIPWGRFKAFRDKSVTKRFMKAVGVEGQKAFREGMEGPHSGRKHSNLPNRSSAAGEYPATQSGQLLASSKHVATDVRTDLGTSKFYGRFLRNGTSKMARRKMSDDALQAGIKEARPQLKGWAKWKRA